MNAEQLFNYLDSIRSERALSKIPVYISEKQGLFGARHLDSAVFVSPSSCMHDSLVLCPTSVTRAGEEFESIFGDVVDDKKK